MRDRSKILIIIAAVILCAAMLSACGAAPQNEATAAEPAAVPSSLNPNRSCRRAAPSRWTEWG